MKNFCDFLSSFFSTNKVTPVEPLLNELNGLTKAGIRTVAHYYHLKYPDRGQIIPVFLKEESLAEDVKILREQEITLPAKLTVSSIKRGTDQPRHSHPFILTQDKLISLREDEVNKELHRGLAKALNVTLIKPHKGWDDSFQLDQTSCHMISLAILKDINAEDLTKICAFEEGYRPTAKLLKYCQSMLYLEEMLTEETRAESVKKSGKTVMEYFAEHMLTADEYIFKTRINEKADAFEARLKAQEPSSKTTAEVAQKMLGVKKSKEDPTRI